MGRNLKATVGKHKLENAKFRAEHDVGMLACGHVRDRHGNKHFTTTAESDERRHAEQVMLDSIMAHYRDKGLSAAKVTIFMPNSPCRACTPRLLKWCDAAEKAISGNGKTVNFVFAFDRIYKSASANANDKILWESDEAAEAEYAKIVKEAGKIAVASDNQNGTRSVARIKFVDVSRGFAFDHYDVAFPSLGNPT